METGRGWKRPWEAIEAKSDGGRSATARQSVLPDGFVDALVRSVRSGLSQQQVVAMVHLVLSMFEGKSLLACIDRESLLERCKKVLDCHQRR